MTRSHILAVLAAAAMPLIASAGSFTGPSSSAAPYLVPVAGGPSFDVYSILTAGDSIGGYTMAGTPDGIGAFAGAGTMTLMMNHEFGTTAGVTRAHGGAGSFVSRWNINTTPGANFLKVNAGTDLDNSVVTTSNGAGASNAFNRYCSADLAVQSAFYNSATGFGTQTPIYLNGEESGTAGRAMAHVVGASSAIGYQLNAFDNLGAWENFLAHPNLSDTTLVMANSDGGTRNGVYAYIGTKQNTGTDLQRAGLTKRKTYGITVSTETVVNNVPVTTPVTAEDRTNALSAATPTLTGRFGLSEITRDLNGAVTGGNTGTTFLRPEDGAWDASRPNDYYFVTTDQYDQSKDGVGAVAGRSRLWRMRYDNVANPTAGGTIEALLDGTEATQMLDNITVVPGVDGHTRILAVEDVGNNSHNGKLWMYEPDTDVLTLVAQHFGSNGDIGTGATGPFNVDEEFSGIVDARDTLGLGWFLLDDQQHFAVAGAQVEGGQLMAIYLPSAIPEPTSLGLLAAGSIAALRRRRR